MKYLKYYTQLQEAMTQEEIMRAHRNERAFITHMEIISKKILSPEEEEDIEHPVSEKLGEIILRIYDNNFYDKANSTGLTEEDYNQALELMKPELDKFRMSKGGQKLIGAYLKRKAKAEPKPIANYTEDTPLNDNLPEEDIEE